MPASIFSETELARLASFPEKIPGNDLIRAFTLTGADRDLVAIRRGAEGGIGRNIDLGHLSPALYGHVNPYGKYRFEIEGRAPSLRPLRKVPLSTA